MQSKANMTSLSKEGKGALTSFYQCIKESAENEVHNFADISYGASFNSSFTIIHI